MLSGLNKQNILNWHIRTCFGESRRYNLQLWILNLTAPPPDLAYCGRFLQGSKTVRSSWISLQVWVAFGSNLGPASQRVTLGHRGLDTGVTWVTEGDRGEDLFVLCAVLRPGVWLLRENGCREGGC